MAPPREPSSDRTSHGQLTQDGPEIQSVSDKHKFTREVAGALSPPETWRRNGSQVTAKGLVTRIGILSETNRINPSADHRF